MGPAACEMYEPFKIPIFCRQDFPTTVSVFFIFTDYSDVVDVKDQHHSTPGRSSNFICPGSSIPRASMPSHPIESMTAAIK